MGPDYVPLLPFMGDGTFARLTHRTVELLAVSLPSLSLTASRQKDPPAA